MFVNTFSRRVLFNFVSIFLFLSIYILLFYDLYTSDTVTISFAVNPFNICEKYPDIWLKIKITYIFISSISSLICINLLYSSLFTKNKTKIKKLLDIKDNLFLFVANDNFGNPIILPESSLYQNILITGTIGSGKTSSAMYPFTRQLIKYKYDDGSKKLGMLILDVKGNYYSQVEKYAKYYRRQKDLVVIELGGDIKYNPLDKPNLKPAILANRLKTILTLFSKNNSESYWLDKAEQVMTECIKFCRLYNDGYVTFTELHKLITIPDYYSNKISIMRENFLSGKLTNRAIHDLLSSIEFFEKEFNTLDTRTSAILKSEITRITGSFVSDFDILSTFSPPKEELNFFGFEEMIEKGKIVVLNMNISEYRNLSKIIAAYLKLDFQTEVMARLAKSNSSLRSVAFISDEYHEYVTDTDADFFAQSREAKCINIVATQSYTSLLNAINNQYTVKVIIQNLINKFWFRTDDTFTIEDAQKQLGKEEKQKYSKSISESSKNPKFSPLSTLLSYEKPNFSESLNSYTQFDFIFDTNFFTQKLDTFSCLTFLSTGTSIIPPQKINLIPYFIIDKTM